MGLDGGLGAAGAFAGVADVAVAVARLAAGHAVAVARAALGAAAAVADGLVAHPVFTRQYMTETVAPLLAGTDCRLLPYIITSIHDDPDVARNEARGQIAFYYTTRLYHSILAGSGSPLDTAIVAGGASLQNILSLK